MGGFSVSASDVILNSLCVRFGCFAYQNGAFSWALDLKTTCRFSLIFSIKSPYYQANMSF